MAFTICTAEQRTDDWFAARLGRLTGSRAADMLATVKSGEAAARRDYRMQLVCERLTGRLHEDGYVNTAMVRGIELEPLAREAYELKTGLFVHQTGFLAHDTHMAGCSVDGHVREFVGIVELKCPKSATHLRYLRGNTMPQEHLPQVSHNLWITGAEWCDFVSFDDRFPEAMQLFVTRVWRDEKWLKEYEKLALTFLREVDLEVQAIKTMVAPLETLREAAAR